MSKLTLAIPVFNQLDSCKGILASMKYVTSDDVEWLVIDNGSTDDYENFFLKTLKPKRINFVRNDENVGLVKTYQQIYELCETEFLAIVHNDIFIYENGWDKRVISKFNEIADLGVVGFFGAPGCGSIGERIQDAKYPGQMAGWSSMLEAEVHGRRMDSEYKPVSIFDGFALIMKMEMLKKVGGIDQRYHYHHLYDRELGLISLALGYKNIVLNVSCHHWSGMTANRSEYQTWIDKKTNHIDYAGDKWTHDENTRIFTEKWKDYLPIYIEDDFSFRAGKYDIWDFKGDNILKFKR